MRERDYHSDHYLSDSNYKSGYAQAKVDFKTEIYGYSTLKKESERIKKLVKVSYPWSTGTNIRFDLWKLTIIDSIKETNQELYFTSQIKAIKHLKKLINNFKKKFSKKYSKIEVLPIESSNLNKSDDTELYSSLFCKNLNNTTGEFKQFFISKFSQRLQVKE